jgi:hypothetical protein
MIELFMKWLRPVPKVIREGELERIANLLYPEPEEKIKDGMVIVVDRSVDANLNAALLDLEDDTNDETTRRTIRACLQRLTEVREILEARHRVNERARFLIVDTPGSRSKDFD